MQTHKRRPQTARPAIAAEEKPGAAREVVTSACVLARDVAAEVSEEAVGDGAMVVGCAVVGCAVVGRSVVLIWFVGRTGEAEAAGSATTVLVELPMELSPGQDMPAGHTPS